MLTRQALIKAVNEFVRSADVNNLFIEKVFYFAIRQGTAMNTAILIWPFFLLNLLIVLLKTSK